MQIFVLSLVNPPQGRYDDSLMVSKSHMTDKNKMIEKIEYEKLLSAGEIFDGTIKAMPFQLVFSSFQSILGFTFMVILFSNNFNSR